MRKREPERNKNDYILAFGNSVDDRQVGETNLITAEYLDRMQDSGQLQITVKRCEL